MNTQKQDSFISVCGRGGEVIRCKKVFLTRFTKNNNLKNKCIHFWISLERFINNTTIIWFWQINVI